MIEKQDYFEPRLKQFYISQFEILNNEKTPFELLNSPFETEKITGLINLPNYLIKGFSTIIGKQVFSLKKSPFIEQVSLPEFVRNNGKIIYFFNSNEKKYVLKLYSPKLFEKEIPIKYSLDLNKEYTTLKEWFYDLPNLIPNEIVIITNSNISGLATTAIIQNFVCGEKIDLLEKNNQKELISIFKNDSYLKKQFQTMTERIKQIYLENGNTIDLNPGNLFVIKNNQTNINNLVYLDTHPILSKKFLDNKLNKKYMTERTINELNKMSNNLK